MRMLILVSFLTLAVSCKKAPVRVADVSDQMTPYAIIRGDTVYYVGGIYYIPGKTTIGDIR